MEATFTASWSLVSSWSRCCNDPCVSDELVAVAWLLNRFNLNLAAIQAPIFCTLDFLTCRHRSNYCAMLT
jgi:hypothetical protein